MRSKKLICLVLSIILIVSSVAVSFVVFANDSGTGYEYNALTNTLTISSDEAMIDKTEESYAENPWSSYANSVKHIIVQDGVTKISSLAFVKMDSLEDAEIANSVASISEDAFGAKTDFICNCEAGSFAQAWCFKNYVPFNTPFEGQKQNITIDKAGERTYWSITPLTDCKITYSATGKHDTVGYIFDAETYIYSTNELTTRKSAVEYNDDKSDDDLNFSISTTLKAGKRYYLSTALKSAMKTGSYTVEFNQVCAEHIYSATDLEVNVLNGRKSLVKARCIGCSNETSIDFGTAVINNTAYCDVNNDGVVNAKDYAILLHK